MSGGQLAVISSAARHIDCEAAEYHARPEWSQSQFKLLPDHPELFHGFHIAKRWAVEVTDDMEIGTQLHGVWLEKKPLLIIPPEALTSNGQRRGNAWKQWCEEHPDNPGVLPKDAGRIQAMAEGGMADPVIRGLIEADGEIEHTVVWNDAETGLPLRARLDKLPVVPGSGYCILDIKSTSIDPGDERLVSAKIWTMKYHQQAACYVDAATLLYGPPLQFIFLFVRNRAPFNAVAWVLNDNDLDLGRRHNRESLLDLARRMESGDWTGSRHGRLNPVSLPRYAWTDAPLSVGDPQPFTEFSAYE
jgi:hypothetical protein